MLRQCTDGQTGTQQACLHTLKEKCASNQTSTQAKRGVHAHVQNKRQVISTADTVSNQPGASISIMATTTTTSSNGNRNEVQQLQGSGIGHESAPSLLPCLVVVHCRMLFCTGASYPLLLQSLSNVLPQYTVEQMQRTN